MYIEVKELAPLIRQALDQVRYGARDIQFEVVEEVTFQSYSGQGSRAFTVLVNLATGEIKPFVGSWGGSNMFERKPVDLGNDRLPMPTNGVVIKGSMGHPRTYATIYCHPQMTGRFLPSGSEEQLSDDEKQALYCFVAIKSGPYRRDELRRRRVSESTLDALVERGYLKRARNGAMSLTTKGKNAPVR